MKVCCENNQAHENLKLRRIKCSIDGVVLEMTYHSQGSRQ